MDKKRKLSCPKILSFFKKQSLDTTTVSESDSHSDSPTNIVVTDAEEINPIQSASSVSADVLMGSNEIGVDIEEQVSPATLLLLITVTLGSIGVAIKYIN